MYLSLPLIFQDLARSQIANTLPKVITDNYGTLYTLYQYMVERRWIPIYNLTEFYNEMLELKRRYNNSGPSTRKGMLSLYVNTVDKAFRRLEDLNRDVDAHDASVAMAVKEDIANRLCDLKIPLDVIYSAVYANGKDFCKNILTFDRNNYKEG